MREEDPPKLAPSGSIDDAIDAMFAPTAPPRAPEAAALAGLQGRPLPPTLDTCLGVVERLRRAMNASSDPEVWRALDLARRDHPAVFDEARRRTDRGQVGVP